MIAGLYYDRRRATAARATHRNLRDSSEAHRRIYQAIRGGHPNAAADAMNEHLQQSSAFQAEEQEQEAM